MKSSREKVLEMFDDLRSFKNRNAKTYALKTLQEIEPILMNCDVWGYGVWDNSTFTGTDEVDIEILLSSGTHSLFLRFHDNNDSSYWSWKGKGNNYGKKQGWLLETSARELVQRFFGTSERRDGAKKIEIIGSEKAALKSDVAPKLEESKPKDRFSRFRQLLKNRPVSSARRTL